MKTIGKTNIEQHLLRYSVPYICVLYNARFHSISFMFILYQRLKIRLSFDMRSKDTCVQNEKRKTKNTTRLIELSKVNDLLCIGYYKLITLSCQ